MDYLLIYTIPSIAFILIVFCVQKRKVGLRRLVFVAFILLQGIYLIWRIIYTIPTEGLINMIAATSLYLAELVGFTQTCILIIIFWTPFKRTDKKLTDLKELPTVDLLIATYNEDINIVKPTIIGALNLDYPKDKLNIYVCDDGDRNEMKILAEQYGVGYITRDNNIHAKAGNLNHALTLTSGEIIVTQDADMIPKTNFLSETLGHFENSNVAFVQTPQTFYNTDIFQHNLYADYNINNEQDFFMRVLQEGKDAFNASIYIGSNALFRRKALDSIGGFATGIITEDMATGLILQNNGWDTVYVNKPLASGLSPETLADYLKQRDRWGRGNVQVFKKYPLSSLKELSFFQKILYLDGVAYWFSGLKTLFFLISPSLYLIFGVISLKTNINSLLIFWLPSYVVSQLVFKSISKNKFSILMNSIYDLVGAPQITWSVLKELFSNNQNSKKFHVTIKGINTDKVYFNLKNSFPQIILLGINLLSIVVILYKLLNHIVIPIQILNLNLYWLIYNIFTLLLAIRVGIERPRLPFCLAINEQAKILISDRVIELPLVGITSRSLVIQVPSNQINKLIKDVNKNKVRISFLDLENISMRLSKVIHYDNYANVLLSRTTIKYSDYFKWHKNLFSNHDYQVGELVFNHRLSFLSMKRNKKEAKIKLEIFK